MEFNFRPDREAHLRMLCEEMGRSVDDFVNEAILTFMEDYEDGRDAAAAMAEYRAGNERTYTTEELMREYGLEARDLAESSEAVGSTGHADQETNPEFSGSKASQAA